MLFRSDLQLERAEHVARALIVGEDRADQRVLTAEFRIAVDPAAITHRAYRLPKVDATWEVVSALRRNPSGELPEALPLWEATKALGRLDGFSPTATDRDDGNRTWNQSIGEFLIDRDGIVRWLYVEGATTAGYMAKFSSEEALLSAAHALPPRRPRRMSD